MSPVQLVDYADIGNEAWRRLNTAADDQEHPLRLFTVATVDERLKADARLLVLRGASRDDACLWFHTDVRSRKTAQVRTHSSACAVAYDWRDGIQLRVRGTVSVHCTDELADWHWEQTDVAVRYAYAISQTPGQALSPHDPRTEAHRRRLHAGDDLAGRENFAVLEIAVESIDWLQLDPVGDRRAILYAANDWRAEPLVP